MTTKMTTILVRQARCAALGFWPGPLDGIDGRRTRAAFETAFASQCAKGLPFEHPPGVTRVHWHWKAGNHTPNVTDLSVYHILIPADGPLFARSGLLHGVATLSTQTAVRRASRSAPWQVWWSGPSTSAER